MDAAAGVLGFSRVHDAVACDRFDLLMVEHDQGGVWKQLSRQHVECGFEVHRPFGSIDEVHIEDQIRCARQLGAHELSDLGLPHKGDFGGVCSVEHQLELRRNDLYGQAGSSGSPAVIGPYPHLCKHSEDRLSSAGPGIQAQSPQSIDVELSHGEHERGPAGVSFNVEEVGSCVHLWVPLVEIARRAHCDVALGESASVLIDTSWCELPPRGAGSKRARRENSARLTIPQIAELVDQTVDIEAAVWWRQKVAASPETALVWRTAGVHLTATGVLANPVDALQSVERAVCRCGAVGRGDAPTRTTHPVFLTIRVHQTRHWLASPTVALFAGCTIQVAVTRRGEVARAVVADGSRWAVRAAVALADRRALASDAELAGATLGVCRARGHGHTLRLEGVADSRRHTVGVRTTPARRVGAHAASTRPVVLAGNPIWQRHTRAAPRRRTVLDALANTAVSDDHRTVDWSPQQTGSARRFTAFDSVAALTVAAFHVARATSHAAQTVEADLPRR